MKKIEGSPKNLKQLLQNTKYSIHYYQREYMWQRKHIEELIDDLTSEFFGTKSFNINVGDRQDCMNAIFNDTDFDTTGDGESVKNLYG